MNGDPLLLLFSQQINLQFCGQENLEPCRMYFHTLHPSVPQFWHLMLLLGVRQNEGWQQYPPVNTFYTHSVLTSPGSAWTSSPYPRSSPGYHSTCSSHLFPVKSCSFNAFIFYAIQKKMLYGKIWYSLWCGVSKVGWLRMEWDGT